MLLLYALLGLDWVAVCWHPYRSGIIREAPEANAGGFSRAMAADFEDVPLVYDDPMAQH